ncbi:hypothetical protein BJ508DRAFT_324806 [Ascobolus immersus RN42]|uniref:Uncharacterized protein n=1 Tax=Ascobolus immersus RN42 TaxID=1160509 RepID=A0A3N4IAW7_ASCIM|nr:hypothetical protein BJ508DRAFT_324806 [Ascobolus immersus RN42]
MSDQAAAPDATATSSPRSSLQWLSRIILRIPPFDVDEKFKELTAEGVHRDIRYRLAQEMLANKDLALLFGTARRYYTPSGPRMKSTEDEGEDKGEEFGFEPWDLEEGLRTLELALQRLRKGSLEWKYSKERPGHESGTDEHERIGKLMKKEMQELLTNEVPNIINAAGCLLRHVERLRGREEEARQAMDEAQGPVQILQDGQDAMQKSLDKIAASNSHTQSALNDPKAKFIPGAEERKAQYEVMLAQLRRVIKAEDAGVDPRVIKARRLASRMTRLEEAQLERHLKTLQADLEQLKSFGADVTEEQLLSWLGSVCLRDNMECAEKCPECRRLAIAAHEEAERLKREGAETVKRKESGLPPVQEEAEEGTKELFEVQVPPCTNHMHHISCGHVRLQELSKKTIEAQDEEYADFVEEWDENVMNQSQGVDKVHKQLVERDYPMFQFKFDISLFAHMHNVAYLLRGGGQGISDGAWKEFILNDAKYICGYARLIYQLLLGDPKCLLGNEAARVMLNAGDQARLTEDRTQAFPSADVGKTDTIPLLPKKEDRDTPSRSIRYALQELNLHLNSPHWHEETADPFTTSLHRLLVGLHDLGSYFWYNLHSIRIKNAVEEQHETLLTQDPSVEKARSRDFRLKYFHEHPPYPGVVCTKSNPQTGGDCTACQNLPGIVEGWRAQVRAAKKSRRLLARFDVADELALEGYRRELMKGFEEEVRTKEVGKDGKVLREEGGKKISQSKGGKKISVERNGKEVDGKKTDPEAQGGKSVDGKEVAVEQDDQLIDGKETDAEEHVGKKGKGKEKASESVDKGKEKDSVTTEESDDNRTDDAEEGSSSGAGDV